MDEGEPARLIADAVRRCPDVVRLSGGRFGDVGTYLPGERIVGVAVRETEVEVRVVAAYGRPLADVAEEIRAAVAAPAGGRRVAVTIDDLDTGRSGRVS